MIVGFDSQFAIFANRAVSPPWHSYPSTTTRSPTLPLYAGTVTVAMVHAVHAAVARLLAKVTNSDERVPKMLLLSHFDMFAWVGCTGAESPPNISQPTLRARAIAANGTYASQHDGSCIFGALGGGRGEGGTRNG